MYKYRYVRTNTQIQNFKLANPTIAVYTQCPNIDANAIASHLDLGMQPPIPSSRSELTYKYIQIQMCKSKYRKKNKYKIPN